MHQEALGGGVAEFDAALKARACPFLNALGPMALGEMRSVYEQIDAGNYEALDELAERLVAAVEQRADAIPAPESEKIPAAEAEEPKRATAPIMRQTQPEAAQEEPDKAVQAARADTLQPALIIDNELRTKEASEEYSITDKPLSQEVISHEVINHDFVDSEPEPAEIIAVDTMFSTPNLFAADEPKNEVSEPAEAVSSTPEIATIAEPEDYAEGLDEVLQFASLDPDDDETAMNDYIVDTEADWLPADNRVAEPDEPLMLETAVAMDFSVPLDDSLDAEVLPYPVNEPDEFDVELARLQESDEETHENITEALLALKPEVAAEANQLLDETAKLIKKINQVGNTPEAYQQNVTEVSEKIVQLFELLDQKLSPQEVKRFATLLLDADINQPDVKLDKILMDYVLGDYGTHEGLAYSLKAVGPLQKIKLSLNIAIGRLALISPFDQPMDIATLR